MNILIPFAFAALYVAQTPADSVATNRVEVFPAFDNTVEMIAAVDSVAEQGVSLLISDVLGTEGGSRRIIVSRTADNTPVDVIDGGPWGGNGVTDDFYFTDRRRETLSGWFKVDDAAPSVSAAPEGGLLIEFTDRIELHILNHDTAEKTVYTLRDNQITYKVGDDGRFRLLSIRPKPDDIRAVGRSLQVFDVSDGSNETSLDAAAFSNALRRLFPFPGRVDKPILPLITNKTST